MLEENGTRTLKFLGKISFNQEFFIQPNYQSGAGVGKGWFVPTISRVKYSAYHFLLQLRQSFYLLTSFSNRVIINGTDCALHLQRR